MVEEGGAELRAKIRDSALRLLTVRARSRAELGRRLRRKGYPAGPVETCLDRLTEQGLLDDRAFAAALARQRLGRTPRGPRRILQELRRFGVDPGVADAALDEALEDEGATVRELALRAARGWVRRQPAGALEALDGAWDDPERERARRRLHGYLRRRGFTPADSRAALERLIAETD